MSREVSELDRAIDAQRGENGEQPALFEEAAAVPAVRKPIGRPVGSRNLRSEAYAALLISRAGADPLEIAVAIAAKNVLDSDTVQQLAAAWGCSRFEAVKLWAAINRDVQPYLHQTLPRAVVVNPGAPGGDRVLLDVEGEFVDVTPTEEDSDAA